MVNVTQVHFLRAAKIKMSRLILFISLFISLSGLTTLFCNCTTVDREPSIINQAEELAPINLPFELELLVNKMDDLQFELIATIETEEGSYIVSPFSPDTILMHFGIFFEETDDLEINAPLIETPISQEEYEAVLESNVRYIREKTTYSQKMKVVSQEDFTTTGTVEFLVEPSCIPYVVDFILSHQNGKMTIHKTKTRTHPSYKGEFKF